MTRQHARVCECHAEITMHMWVKVVLAFEENYELKYTKYTESKTEDALEQGSQNQQAVAPGAGSPTAMPSCPEHGLVRSSNETKIQSYQESDKC